MSAITKTRKFWRLANFEKKLFLVACFYLTICTLAVKLVPFRILSRCLGKSFNAVPIIGGITENEKPKRVGDAIRRAAAHLPWRSVCLPQAMAAKLMLQRRKILSTLYIGVDKNEQGELGAHAWLSVGRTNVTGYRNTRNYTVIAIYS